jgi:hypothetical protein
LQAYGKALKYFLAKDKPNMLHHENQPKERKITMNTKKFLAILIVVIMATVIFTGCNAKPYGEAVTMFNEGNFAEAAAAFEALGDYKDAPERAIEARALDISILVVRTVDLSGESERFVYFTKNGYDVDMPLEMENWFENATVGNSLSMRKAGNPRFGIICAFIVDGVPYSIYIYDDTQFVVSSTSNGGFNLLPEETMALQPSDT